MNYEKGMRAFGVLPSQSIFRGTVLSQRGCEIRIVNEVGVVRAFHARYVFPA
jgi:hypothetical protein